MKITIYGWSTSALGARGRASCKRQVSGSIPLTSSQVNEGEYPLCAPVRGTNDADRGYLVPGDELPSITEVSARQGIGTGVIRHALEALAADGLIIVRHGRAAVVAGEPGGDPRLSRRRPGPGHDCRRAGCRPHVCHPMKPGTIRGIHSILSGAFAAAQRWERTGRNPAESAKPPTTTRQPIPATSPDDVAKVIGQARAHDSAARLGHSGGGATTLRHYADPVPEVDRRAAAYLAQLTATSTPLSPQPMTGRTLRLGGAQRGQERQTVAYPQEASPNEAICALARGSGRASLPQASRLDQAAGASGRPEAVLMLVQRIVLYSPMHKVQQRPGSSTRWPPGLTSQRRPARACRSLSAILPTWSVFEGRPRSVMRFLTLLA